MPKFYTFTQDNSGGSFDYDKKRGITNFVIIEANNADEANARAETIGLYFDGRGDCPCCGNRWCEARDPYDATKTPELYEMPLAEYMEQNAWCTVDMIATHYADGRIEWGAPTATEKAT